jgi:pimeloyl-ACP methyl ester carboxylesterase
MTARIVAAAALLSSLALPAPAIALTFKPCSSRPGIQCSSLDVPLDRSGRVPGTLRLHVERVPARGTSRGALFVLEGGPGASVTATTRDYVAAFYRQLANRDLILVDQRGTGLSGTLRCPKLKIPDSSAALGQADAAAACAAKLGLAASLYTTRASAGDIDAVRQALGIEKIALYGSSYGTKLALAYSVLYPAHVERMVLDSVVPLDEDGFDLDSFRAIPRVLDKLCATGCEGITTDPVADTARLVAAIRQRGVLKGTVIDARGRRRPARMGRTKLAGILFSGDYTPVFRAAYPGAVRSALAGDLTPLLRLATWTRRGSEPAAPRYFSDAMYTANTCQEGPFPWNPAAPAASRVSQARAAAAALPTSSVHPFDRDTALISSAVSLCAKWPSPEDSPVPSGPFPAAPTLVLAGEDDLRTPLEGAERVARAIPGAQLLVMPGTGHGVFPSNSVCPRRAVDDFFDGRPLRPCRPGLEPPFADPMPPRSLAQVPVARGHHGVVGRTLTAVLASVSDVDEALNVADYSFRGFAQVGGLRAGYAHDNYPRIRLHGYSYVPGVRVSGRLDGARNQHGTLRVSGSAAAHGHVRLHRDGSVTGRLEGRRVRIAGARASVVSAADARHRHVHLGRKVARSGARARDAGRRARLRLDLRDPHRRA